MSAANSRSGVVASLLSNSPIFHTPCTTSLRFPSQRLGNEFYNEESDYVTAFPTGADYGRTASTWLAAVRAAYPAAAISVVGVPSYRSGNKPRLTSWNQQLFATLVGARAGDGVSMHEYDATGAGTGSTFTAKDVPVMLATPFATAARIATAAAALPDWASIWITEYNLLYNANKPDVPAFGTWAHGLYLAAETLLVLTTVPKVAAGRVCRHCLFSFAADGALFEDTASFDFAMSPNKKLPTLLYGRSAAAEALALIGNASFARTSFAPLSFSPNPKTPGGVDSLVGASFTGGPGGGRAAAVIVNLAPGALQLSAAETAGYTAFVQVSAADATTPVNKESAVTKSAGAVTAKLSLPAYSVTHLY